MDDESVTVGSRRSTRAPRIAILVLGCRLTVYDRCINTIRATWGAKPAASVDVFYVYGGQRTSSAQEMVDVETLVGQTPPRLRDGDVWVSGDVILCGAADVHEDQLNCILRKRLIAFGYLANQQAYDFVYTVCASSYVDVKGLALYVSLLPSTGVYHGALNVHGETGYPFVSGASFLLSRDIAADLADNALSIVAAFPEDLPDDVAIGHVIARKYGGATVSEIASRIGDGRKPTDNQTFVIPHELGSVDFVNAPAYSQVPDQRAYHFHFHSRRMWEMENFHRRFFLS